jgi:hypothetical protein
MRETRPDDHGRVSRPCPARKGPRRLVIQAQVGHVAPGMMRPIATAAAALNEAPPRRPAGSASRRVLGRQPIGVLSTLTRDDFEVLQDRRPQTISTFACSAPARALRNRRQRRRRCDRGLNHAAVPSQVRRTIAIVIDDLNLSFQSIARLRETLRRIVDTSASRVISSRSCGPAPGWAHCSSSPPIRARFMRRSIACAGTCWGASRRSGHRKRRTSFWTTSKGTVHDRITECHRVRGPRHVGVAGRKSILLVSDGFRLTDAGASTVGSPISRSEIGSPHWTMSATG